MRFLNIGVFILIFFSELYSNENLRVFISWPGYSYKPFYMWDNKKSSFTGIDAKIIDLLLKDAELDFEYVFPRQVGPYPRIEVLTNDKADISIRSFSITEDRKKVIDFTNPYYYDGQTFLVRKNSGIESVKDLKGKKILAYSNTTGYEYLLKNDITDKVVVDIPRQYLNSPSKMVSDGLVDALINDKSNLIFEANRDGGLLVLEEQLTNEPWGIGVKKGNDELREILNKYLKKNIENGKIKEIFKKYNVSYDENQ